MYSEPPMESNVKIHAASIEDTTTTKLWGNPR